MCRLPFHPCAVKVITILIIAEEFTKLLTLNVEENTATRKTKGKL